MDGTPDGLTAAVQSLRDNPACVALSGTVSDPVATRLVALLRRDGLAIAHVAPWLQNSIVDIDERTFPIFAARQEQIGHALKSLSALGVQEVGAVFASRREHELYREDTARIAAGMKLKLRSYPGTIPLTQLGQQMDQGTPAVLLFIGGTPELVQFTQGLDKPRAARDLGGYRVSFDANRRSATYVTQSMLTADGRVVG